MAPQSRLLLLPTEVRVMIYRSLFSNLKVTVAGSNTSADQGPWAIMRTCWKCYEECLPIFYELATVRLKHEAYHYVLRRKIGEQNMARLQSVEIGGLHSKLDAKIATELPHTLKTLYLSWKGAIYFYNSTPKGSLVDGDIQVLLDRTFRPYLDHAVTELFTKNPNLKVYLDTLVGNAPSAEVCLY